MKTKYILFLFLLAAVLVRPLVVGAQDMKQADKHYNNFEFTLALEAYKKILENGEPNLTVVQRIADSYRILNNSKEAEFWYAQAVSFPGTDPANIFFYAESAKRNGHYQKAKQLFEEYGRTVPTQTAMALRLAASCDTALTWIQRPRPLVLNKIQALNSHSADFSPAKIKDGLLFASDRIVNRKNEETKRDGWTGNGYVQMYFAKALTDSTWSTPAPLPNSINTAYHNGPATFLEKDQLLFFTRTHIVKGRTSKTNPDPTNWFKGTASGTHINRLGIYTAERKGEERWGSIKPFKYNNTEEYSVGHPAITTDGKFLYFASDMPGGFGETDIYYSQRQPDGSWGKPVNAGNVVNTAGRESFPSIGADGVLYFTSDGHLGMGGLDIFKAVGPVTAWTEAKNLRYPLNTSQDDFGIMMDETGKNGLISSSRDTNFDDIFTFKENKIPCTLVGRTIERVPVAKTGKTREVPIERVLLQLFEEGSTVPVEVYSDKNGNFSFIVKAATNYTIKGSKPKYLNQTLTMTPDCRFNTDSVKVEMVFNRNTPNKPIALENIYYDIDKTNINPEAAKELDKLVQTLNDNPKIRIELSSHTDSRQSNRYNEMLSQLRAQSAVDYIVSKGIDRNRLVAKGYGETKLLNKCKDDVPCSENQHQQNRRTEFKILR